MKKVEELFTMLGIKYYSARHIRIVADFIDSKQTDILKLLDKLGEWDNSDLLNAEKWFKNLKKELE